jgi:hypothetical protein
MVWVMMLWRVNGVVSGNVCETTECDDDCSDDCSDDFGDDGLPFV